MDRFERAIVHEESGRCFGEGKEDECRHFFKKTRKNDFE